MMHVPWSMDNEHVQGNKDVLLHVMIWPVSANQKFYLSKRVYTYRTCVNVLIWIYTIKEICLEQ